MMYSVADAPPSRPRPDRDEVEGRILRRAAVCCRRIDVATLDVEACAAHIAHADHVVAAWRRNRRYRHDRRHRELRCKVDAVDPGTRAVGCGPAVPGRGA